MISPQAASEKSAHDQAAPLGPRVYGSGFQHTTLMMGFGVALILVVPIVAVVNAAGGFLFAEVIFGPIGALAIRSGLRQQKIRLTLLQDRFEYQDASGRLHSSPYAAIKAVSHNTIQGIPNGISVVLHDGSSIDIKCLSTDGTFEALEDLKRRI